MQAPPASAKERRLKRLIADSPSLLPGADERPAAVATEVRMPGAGFADVVVVDAEGEITIVECKLAKNPEMRRWVIGQLFEYAAALWRLDIEDFERSLASRGTALTKPFKDPARWKEATFRSTVSQNLAAGAFRMIIAVDEITDRLKRTVVFINSHTPPEVRFLALELRRAGEKGVQLPVPVVSGDNSAEIEPLQPTWKPDKWAVMDGIRGADAAGVAEGLLDWAERREPRLGVRYTEKDGVVEARVGMPAGTLFRIKGHRDLRVSLKALGAHGEPGEEGRTRKVLADIDPRFEGGGNWPIAPLECLADESKREEFLALMERVLETLSG